MKTILLLLTLLSPAWAQRPDSVAQERLREDEAIDQLDWQDNGNQREESQQGTPPVDVQCECVCPQSTSGGSGASTEPEALKEEAEKKVQAESAQWKEQKEEEKKEWNKRYPEQNEYQYSDPTQRYAE